jgi:hypothetical protein
MGAVLLTEEQYRRLQRLGEFDTKTSSWLQTPPDIRRLGGAIFGDYRYGTVFVYHKGAEILLRRQGVPLRAHGLVLRNDATGPRTWPMAECSMEFRVGGIWHYCLRGPNKGDESWGRAMFTEIAAQERIVYTDAFSDADGNIEEGMPQTQSTIEFADTDGRTRLTA